MSCKSAIFMVNSGSNAVGEGGSIPLGNVVRKFGRNLCNSGSGVVANGEGYYMVIGNFTVVPTAVGAVSVSVLDNGVAVSGSSQVYASTAEEPINVTVVDLIRNVCCDGWGFVEFVLNSGGGTVTQSNVVVVKL